MGVPLRNHPGTGYRDDVNFSARLERSDNRGWLSRLRKSSTVEARMRALARGLLGAGQGLACHLTALGSIRARRLPACYRVTSTNIPKISLSIWEMRQQKHVPLDFSYLMS